MFDLVVCPVEEHRVAFYSALQNTLVCEDKEIATEIALGGSTRHRVVTIDGVVINTSGTMEGGGRPLSGRIGGGGANSEVLTEQEVRRGRPQRFIRPDRLTRPHVASPRVRS